MGTSEMAAATKIDTSHLPSLNTACATAVLNSGDPFSGRLIYIYIYIKLSLSVCLSISIYLSISPSQFLSIYLSIYLKSV